MALLVYLFQNTSDLFLPYATVVDAKRRPRVKGVDRGGRAIFLPSLIGKYHTNRYTADVHPVGQLLVESVLALRAHILIERVHAGGYIILSAVRHITDWPVQQISRLESHNLIRPVNHYFVVDLWTDDFIFQADVLLSSVVIEQILNFCPVDAMHGQCLSEHIHHIFLGDTLFGGVNFSTPSQPINRPLGYSPNSIVFSHLVTSRQTKMPTNYRGFLGN